MLAEKLKKYRVILGSGSPRRQELLTTMGIPYKLKVKPVDEKYPEDLKAAAIPTFIAKQKAKALSADLSDNDILITADTVVWHHGDSLEKPRNKEQAKLMLRSLSGSSHQVITAVCITTTGQQEVVIGETKVQFDTLSEEEIAFYVELFQPFDKAGGYGIQEWIGLIGISEIQGSYTNVVGLPTQKLYKTLMAMVS